MYDQNYHLIYVYICHLIQITLRKSMSKRIVRIILNEDLFRKYKVYCAINDLSMTDQTNRLVQEFIKDQNDKIKIVTKETN